jgi:hypothetical protein
MPAGTWVIAAWEGGRAEVDIDDNDRIIFARTIGTGAEGMTVKRPDNSRVYTLPPGAREVSVPTSVQNRIQLTWDPVRLRWSGIWCEVLNS